MEQIVVIGVGGTTLRAQGDASPTVCFRLLCNNGVKAMTKTMTGGKPMSPPLSSCLRLEGVLYEAIATVRDLQLTMPRVCNSVG